jgi:hypothetical protein
MKKFIILLTLIFVNISLFCQDDIYYTPKKDTTKHQLSNYEKYRLEKDKQLVKTDTSTTIIKDTIKVIDKTTTIINNYYSNDNDYDNYQYRFLDSYSYPYYYNWYYPYNPIYFSLFYYPYYYPYHRYHYFHDRHYYSEHKNYNEHRRYDRIYPTPTDRYRTKHNYIQPVLYNNRVNTNIERRTAIQQTRSYRPIYIFNNKTVKPEYNRTTNYNNYRNETRVNTVERRTEVQHSNYNQNNNHIERRIEVQHPSYNQNSNHSSSGNFGGGSRRR